MYLIPENVKSKFEFFKGYGAKELVINLIFLVIGLLLSFTIKILLFNNPITYLPTVFFGVGGYFITKEDERFGSSLFGMILSYRKYSKQKNLYVYRFGRGRVE